MRCVMSRRWLRPASRVYSAREAVARYYGERDVSPDRILLTASTSEAYGYLFKLLANPGDEILTPRPSYASVRVSGGGSNR